MKQIPLLQGKALLIELPEGAKFPRIETDQSIIPYGQDLTWDINGGEKSYGMDETEWVSLPPGNWRIIGMLSEVTEEDLTEIIDVLVSSESGKKLYPNFTGGPWKVNRAESLDSAILAKGYVFENPYGEEPIRLPEGHNSHGTHESMWNQWEEGQSRVLDRSRCLLLGREDV